MNVGKRTTGGAHAAGQAISEIVVIEQAGDLIPELGV
jgi:hypothetical protein